MSTTLQPSPLARKLGAFISLTDADLSLLDTLQKRRRSFPAGSDLVHEGRSSNSAYILMQGWAVSYKILPEGTRQIIDLHIPGDFLGLHGVLFQSADHDIASLTPVEVSEVSVNDFSVAFQRSPRLATAALWAVSRYQARLVEHLVSLGRRDARQRIAHFLLELSARLNLVGLGSLRDYECPLTQYLLADALGLSSVHVNRVLRDLREDGLLTVRDGKVIFDDLDRVVALAEFDGKYLDQEGPLQRKTAYGDRPLARVLDLPVQGGRPSVAAQRDVSGRAAADRSAVNLTAVPLHRVS
jgi:CRP-like cAMP-binding protein